MVNSFIPKNKITQQIILFVALVLLIIISVFKLFGVRNLLVSDKMKLAQFNNDYEALESIMKEKNDLKSEMDKVLGTIPGSYLDVAKLVYKIESIADTNGLSTEVSFDKLDKDEDGLHFVLAQFSTQGGFQNYTNFLSAVSSLPYNTAVDSATVENKEGSLKEVTTFKIFLRN